jgi:hypothetical protein
MKAKLTRGLLEMFLNKCFEACEKKSSESVTLFKFKDKNLTLTTKGSFTYLEAEIKNIDCDDMEFTIKTAAILEFVKYISAEEIVIVYDNEKKSCLVSSADKKSKIAFQIIDETFEDNFSSDLISKFSISSIEDFVSKLNYASKFCSNNLDDYPLTGIHCNLEKGNLTLKSTNGPSFYQTCVQVESDNEFEFYIHKKSPGILKNILSNENIVSIGVNNKYFFVETENIKLKMYIEKPDKNSFPSQVTEWLDKESVCQIKVSSFEFIKTLKYLNGVISNSIIKISTQNSSAILESSQSNFAAKEFLSTEQISGEISASYNTKYLIECLDALPFSWIYVDFIQMQDDFYICKISHDKNISLLCPDIS